MCSSVLYVPVLPLRTFLSAIRSFLISDACEYCLVRMISIYYLFAGYLYRQELLRMQPPSSRATVGEHNLIEVFNGNRALMPASRSDKTRSTSNASTVSVRSTDTATVGAPELAF